MRRVELDNGRIIGLSTAFDTSQPIWPGRLVDFTGTKFNDGLGIADVGIAIDTTTAYPVGGLNINCLALRFTPVQTSFPSYNGPWTKHNIQAYNYGASYWLENGMGVAVESAGCPTKGNTPATSLRYSAEVRLTYTRKSDGVTTTQILAYDLTPSSAPVLLNQIVKLFTTATLTVKTRVQQCSLLSCTAPKEQATTSYPLSLVLRHGRCVASYEKTEVDVDDYGDQKFRAVQVDSTFVLAAADAGQSIAFSALGYKVTGNNTSTFPNAVNIGASQSFAVFRHDFIDSNLLYAEESLGVGHAAGLMWPRVSGIRNGHTFSFSCGLPGLVRDALYLEPSLNTFYRFPFSGGTNSIPEWSLSQGNNGTFTHNGNQKYAFDFVADPNTIIRAARGGRVVFVREDQTGNSFYNPNCTNCWANAVVIRHQDKTETAYFHMPTNGVLVDEDTNVNRGAWIGKVGNTGYSTGAHLHFQEQNSGGVTNQSCFEGGLPFGNMVIPCYIPNSGGYLKSTQ